MCWSRSNYQRLCSSFGFTELYSEFQLIVQLFWFTFSLSHGVVLQWQSQDIWNSNETYGIQAGTCCCVTHSLYDRLQMINHPQSKDEPENSLKIHSAQCVFTLKKADTPPVCRSGEMRRLMHFEQQRERNLWCFCTGVTVKTKNSAKAEHLWCCEYRVSRQMHSSWN